MTGRARRIGAAHMDRLPPNARRLKEGESIQAGDYLAIGDGFYRVDPCRYDREGVTCCVGRKIEGHERYYRVEEEG